MWLLHSGWCLGQPMASNPCSFMKRWPYGLWSLGFNALASHLLVFLAPWWLHVCVFKPVSSYPCFLRNTRSMASNPFLWLFFAYDPMAAEFHALLYFWSIFICTLVSLMYIWPLSTNLWSHLFIFNQWQLVTSSYTCRQAVVILLFMILLGFGYATYHWGVFALSGLCKPIKKFIFSDFHSLTKEVVITEMIKR